MSENEAALEEGRLLFAQECRFMLGVAGLDQLPAAGLPEVAFAGRSNVGKSSLVNALTGRRTLAKTSNTPGRTQQLNYFDLGGRLWLVDLPGYGFAEVPKSVVERWTRLLKAYLKGRPTLRRVCLLIDGRIGIKAGDAEIMTMLDRAAVPYQLVVTKADKPRRPDLEATVAAAAAHLPRHPAAHPEILVTSAETGEGVPALRAALAALASPAALH